MELRRPWEQRTGKDQVPAVVSWDAGTHGVPPPLLSLAGWPAGGDNRHTPHGGTLMKPGEPGRVNDSNRVVFDDLNKSFAARRVDMEVCHDDKQDNHRDPESGRPWLGEQDGRHQDGHDDAGRDSPSRREHGGAGQDHSRREQGRPGVAQGRSQTHAHGEQTHAHGEQGRSGATQGHSCSEQGRSCDAKQDSRSSRRRRDGKQDDDRP